MYLDGPDHEYVFPPGIDMETQVAMTFREVFHTIKCHIQKEKTKAKQTHKNTNQTTKMTCFISYCGHFTSPKVISQRKPSHFIS